MAAICVAAACRQETQTPSASSPSTSRTVSLVAVIGDQLAVMGSDGTRVSCVPGRLTGINSISATPDGRSVMVGPEDCEKNWIRQVDIATGAVEEFVGASEFPVVNPKRVVLVPGIGSPDGAALVAYGVRCAGTGMFGFTDIVTSQNARRSALGETEEASSLPIETVRPLAWLSDGRTLFYAISVRGEAHPRYYFGRVWPLVTPAEEVFYRVAGTLPESGSIPTAAALVDDTTIAFAQEAGKGSQIRLWDVQAEPTAHAERSFQIPEAVAALAADASGMHFLAVTRSRALYRWSVGDAAPTKLADKVSAAAWLP